MERSFEVIHDSRECYVAVSSSSLFTDEFLGREIMDDKQIHENSTDIPKASLQLPTITVGNERPRRYSLTSLKDRRLPFENENDCGRAVEGEVEAHENVDKTWQMKMKPLANHEKRTRHYSLTKSSFLPVHG